MGHIRSKHDAFFKRMMKNTALARDFFATHLPEKILNLVDLSQIKLEDGSFIDENLSEYESDIIFSVKRVDTNDDCFLYTLCEHQSTPDPEMPFRLIYYIMQFLKRHLINHRPSPFPLPFVYPIVVYNGNVAWNTHREFFSLFGELSKLVQDVFFEPFDILEIAKMDEADLKHTHLCNLMLASMLRTKSIQDIERKVRLLDTLFQSCGINVHSETVHTVLKYLMSCVDPNNQKTLPYWITIKQGFSPKYREVVMDLLEATKQEAFQEGIQAGFEEGMQEGFQEGIEKAAKQMIKEGIEKALVARITGLPMSTVQHLAVLTATEG